MKNRYRFRGKRKDNGEWAYGDLIVEEAPLQCLANEREPDKYYIGKSGFADWNMPRPYETVEVIPETVGMWTGKEDINTVNVYEGDLIKGDGYGPYPVEWYKGYWSCCCYKDSDNIYTYKTIEVTGNVHEEGTVK